MFGAEGIEGKALYIALARNEYERCWVRSWMFLIQVPDAIDGVFVIH